jgi:hypothetical protein
VAEGHGDSSGCPKGHLDGQEPLREEPAEGIVICVLGTVYCVLSAVHCIVYSVLCAVHHVHLHCATVQVASGGWASPTTPLITLKDIINHVKNNGCGCTDLSANITALVLFCVVCAKMGMHRPHHAVHNNKHVLYGGAGVDNTHQTTHYTL